MDNANNVNILVFNVSKIIVEKTSNHWFFALSVSLVIYYKMEIVLKNAKMEVSLFTNHNFHISTLQLLQ